MSVVRTGGQVGDAIVGGAGHLLGIGSPPCLILNLPWLPECRYGAGLVLFFVSPQGTLAVSSGCLPLSFQTVVCVCTCVYSHGQAGVCVSVCAHLPRPSMGSKSLL